MIDDRMIDFWPKSLEFVLFSLPLQRIIYKTFSTVELYEKRKIVACCHLYDDRVV